MVEGADVRAQDDELVAREPAHHVALARRRLEPPGQLLQELVTAGVAERVVDELEAVDVDEEHGQVGLVLHRDHQLAVELVVEGLTVAEPGERVVEGHPLELGLGLLAVGHVGEGADDHRRLGPAGPGEEAGAHRQPLEAARPVRDADDDAVRGLTGHLRAHVGEHLACGSGWPSADVAMASPVNIRCPEYPVSRPPRMVAAAWLWALISPDSSKRMMPSLSDATTAS